MDKSSHPLLNKTNEQFKAVQEDKRTQQIDKSKCLDSESMKFFDSIENSDAVRNTIYYWMI